VRKQDCRMNNIKLIISDFDGTLVNTFRANYEAYKRSFEDVGLSLTEDKYRECFGFRYDDMMAYLNITDDEIKNLIREQKAQYYPSFFNLLEVNNVLLNFIRHFKLSGGKTALASTARRENLMNAITYINAEDAFNLILSGESVEKGKPDPEIYLKTMAEFNAKPEETLVFEDSEVGLMAADRAGTKYIRITSEYFNGDRC